MIKETLNMDLVNDQQLINPDNWSRQSSEQSAFS